MSTKLADELVRETSHATDDAGDRTMMACCSAITILLVGTGCGSELVVQTVNEYDARVPCPDVKVQVNDLDWATSDEEGKTYFGAVEPPYTVRVYQSYYGSSGQSDDVWELTDQVADTTVVEVDGTFCGDSRRSEIRGTVTGRSGVPEAETIGVHVHENNTFVKRYEWIGESPYQTVLHHLELIRNPDVFYSPPTQYLRYGSAEVEVSAPREGEGSVSGVTLGLRPVRSERVSGTVTIPEWSTERYASLRLQLPNEPEAWFIGEEELTAQQQTFDYLFPAIPESEAMLYFSAAQGTEWDDPGSAAVREVSLPSTGLQFELPEPVELVEPADGAFIDPNTVFVWTEAAGAGRYSLSVHCSGVESDTTYGVSIRDILTQDTHGSLPSISHLYIPPGSVCHWSVHWFRGMGNNYSAERWRLYSKSATRVAIMQ